MKRFVFILTAAFFLTAVQAGAPVHAQEGMTAEIPATAPKDAAEAPPQAALPAPRPEKPVTWAEVNTVVLRTIDKLSARTGTFEIPVSKTMKFGKSLFIRAEVCRKSSALDKPESAAFLRIWERKPSEEKPTWVFSGWMFASSPSLSAMDHPIYDVWVIECKTAAKAGSSTPLSNEAQPAVKPADAPKVETPATEPAEEQDPED